MSDLDIAWLNGRLVTAAEAGIPFSDPAFLSGLGLFETISVRGGAPCLLDRHLRRMQRGAALLSLGVPGVDAVRQAICDLLHRLGLRDARVRLTVSPDATLITAGELPDFSGVARLIVCPWRRNPHSPLAGLKSTSACAENVLAWNWARARGADEAVFLNTDGFVCEGSRSNILLAGSCGISTPPTASGCLPGVMRGLVLELCAAHGIPVRERNIDPDELATADEILLTSSLRGVQAACMGGTSAPAAPGPLAGTLAALVGAQFRGGPAAEKHGR